MQPQIIVPQMEGHHNRDLLASSARLKKSGSYKDQSTVIICPTRGVVPATVVQSWMNLIRPMNQKVIGPIFIQGMEVGEAYCVAVDMILSNPDLSQFRYILSIEEDNCPPPDGLLKLYEAIEGEVDGQKYDVVGGLYWCKGEGGAPMIYGDPKVFPKNFIPQVPVPEQVQEANGLGQGFNLYRMEMFKDQRLPRPLFKTIQEFTPGVGTRSYTQDLMFYENAAKFGYRFACDNRIKVGHWDQANGIMW